MSRFVEFLDADLYEINVNAPVYVRSFGITYQYAVPQSLLDCWQFWNCENVPDELPKGLTAYVRDPGKGSCLTPEQIQSVLAYRKAREPQK